MTIAGVNHNVWINRVDRHIRYKWIWQTWLILNSYIFNENVMTQVVKG